MVTYKIEQLSVKSDVFYLSVPQLDYTVGRDFFIDLFRPKITAWQRQPEVGTCIWTVGQGYWK